VAERTAVVVVIVVELLSKVPDVMGPQ